MLAGAFAGVIATYGLGERRRRARGERRGRRGARRRRRGRDGTVPRRSDGDRSRRQHPGPRPDELPAARPLRPRRRRRRFACRTLSPVPIPLSRRPARGSARCCSASRRSPTSALALVVAIARLASAHARRPHAARRRREPRRRPSPAAPTRAASALLAVIAGGALGGRRRRRAVAPAGRHVHRRHDQRARLSRPGRHHRRPLDPGRRARRLPALRRRRTRSSSASRACACRSAPT